MATSENFFDSRRVAGRALVVAMTLLASASGPPPVAAQDRPVEPVVENIRRWLYEPGVGSVLAPSDVAACPGNVMIGADPLKIDYEVTTTSPTLVQYTATFSFSNATLDGVVTSDTHGNPSPVVNGGTTTYTVAGALSNTMPFRVNVVTTAIAAGPASTDWEVRRGAIVTTEEHCEFTVLAPTNTSDISVRIANVIGAESFDPASPLATVALDKSVTVCAWIKNSGPDNANDVIVVGDASPQADAGNKAAQSDLFDFALVRAEPQTGTCTSSGPSGFTCSGISIAAGDSVKLNIDGFGVADALGSMGIEAASQANEDPDESNNIDFITVDVVDNGPRGFAVLPVTALTVVGQPIDFFVFDCRLDEDGNADFGPDGLPGTEDDDCVPVPYAQWLLSGTVGTIAPIAGRTSTLTPALPIGTDSAGGAIVAQYDQKNDQAVITVVAPAAIHGRVSFPDTDFELGVDGIAVLLLDADGGFIRQEITHSRDLDGDGVIDPTTERGLYWFEDLLPGTYRLELVLTPPWMPVDVSEMEVPLGPGNIEVPIFEIVPEDLGDLALDFGDLPTPYPDTMAVCPDALGTNRCHQTLRVDDGAVHVIRNGLQLGTVIDGEADGAPSRNADGDDRAGQRNDEDGWYRGNWPLAGGTGTATIGVRNSTDDPAFLHMWIDIDDDGQLAEDPAEYVVRGTIIPGNTGFTLVDAEFPVPEFPAFDPYVRIRLTTDAGSPSNGRPQGLYLDGEVEDYYWEEFAVPGDLGDAPDEVDPSSPDIPAGYPTRLQDDGARHVVTVNVRLGDKIDPELDGQPSINADGDDTDGGLYSDDDGIVFGPGFVVVGATPTTFSPSGFFFQYGVARGTTTTLTPLASVDGKLDGWIDFNRDGDWDDAGEQVFDNVPVKGDPDFTPLELTIPETADPGFTFARFRFSIAGDLEVTGLASDGEVEDYQLQIFDRIAVTSNADSGPGSLREAIAAVNSNTGGDVMLIDLMSAGKTAAVIVPASPLPAISGRVVIQGAGTELDGSSAGAGADGLSISGDGSAVTGLTIRNFSQNGLVVSADNVVVTQLRVANNGGDGIRAPGGGVLIAGTIARANGGLGIDRGGDGATPNDPDESDGIQNYPSIATVEITDSLRVTGSLSSTPDTTFAIELFVGSVCQAGETGADAYAAGTRSVTTDGSGLADFAFALAARSHTAGVTATATGPGAGTSELSACAFATDVDVAAVELPREIRLYGSYPNPARAQVTIPYDLPQQTHVRIDVFNALGRRVTTLLDGDRAAGRHEVVFDANERSAGLYFYRLTTTEITLTRHMIVVR